MGLVVLGDGVDPFFPFFWVEVYARGLHFILSCRVRKLKVLFLSLHPTVTKLFPSCKWLQSDSADMATCTTFRCPIIHRHIQHSYHVAHPHLNSPKMQKIKPAKLWFTFSKLHVPHLLHLLQTLIIFSPTPHERILLPLCSGAVSKIMACPNHIRLLRLSEPLLRLAQVGEMKEGGMNATGDQGIGVGQEWQELKQKSACVSQGDKILHYSEHCARTMHPLVQVTRAARFPATLCSLCPF